MLKFFKKLFLRLFKKQKCFYINGPETLPPPLTKEEEQKIMDELQNGIEDNRELLIIHNLRLVDSVFFVLFNQCFSSDTFAFLLH